MFVTVSGQENIFPPSALAGTLKVSSLYESFEQKGVKICEYVTQVEIKQTKIMWMEECLFITNATKK